MEPTVSEPSRKKRRFDEMEKEVRERSHATPYDVDAEILPEDASLVSALIDFGAKTMAGNQTSLSRHVDQSKIENKFLYHVEPHPPSLHERRLYYEITFSFPPYVIVSYEHLQSLMGMSLGRITSLYTRINMETNRLDVSFHFYTLTMDPPRQIQSIEFVTVRTQPASDLLAREEQRAGGSAGLLSLLRNPFGRGK